MIHALVYGLYLLSLTSDLSELTVVCTLAFSISWITAVWWVPFLVKLWMNGRFYILVEVVLGKSPRVEGGYGISPRTLDRWVETRNSSEYGEESLRHPSLFSFDDFWTGLGEITMVEV